MVGEQRQRARDVRQVGELCRGCAPDFEQVRVGIDDVLEVDGQRSAIGGVSAASGADALGDVEDDACEALFVQVDFLIVWHLTDRAGGVRRGVSLR